MNKSDSIGSIAKAIAAAQREMQNPAFDSQNPHFKSKFASLASVRNAVVPTFAKHGVCVTQDLKSTERGISCTTTLMHESGEWIEFGPLDMPASKPEAQGIGSASTYARRYHMQAVAAVVGDDDDDAEAATGRTAQAAAKKVEINKEDLAALREAALSGLESLQKAFKAITPSAQKDELWKEHGKALKEAAMKSEETTAPY